MFTNYINSSSNISVEASEVYFTTRFVETSLLRTVLKKKILTLKRKN